MDQFDISDHQGVIDADVTTRHQEIINAAVREYNRRIEREVIAAWMAGYAALDVVEPIFGVPHKGSDYGDPAATIRASFHPRHDPDARRPVDLDGYRTTRYDLTALTPELAQQVRRRWGDQDG